MAKVQAIQGKVEILDERTNRYKYVPMDEMTMLVPRVYPVHAVRPAVQITVLCEVTHTNEEE